MAVAIRLSASAEPLLAELDAEAGRGGPALAGPLCRSTKTAATPASIAAAAASGPTMLARDLGLA